MIFQRVLFAVAFCVHATIWSNSELIERGRGSFGGVQIIHYGEPAKLKIGNFCSIAANVDVFLGGDHRTDWVTTYAFTAMWPEVAGHIKGHPRTKGDVIIGNDVWIGKDATILSGVTIGDGAVIGANAVVSKNVPPYAIAVGNPARVVKYRFEEETIAKLLAIAWWNWPDEKIAQAMPFMLSEDINAFIQYCGWR